MITCDAARAAMLLGEPDAAARTHLEQCAECQASRATIGILSQALGAEVPAGPPVDLRERVLRAAAPLLREQGVTARRARAFAGLRLCAAPAIALILLPLVVYAHVTLVAGLYRLLSVVLPRGLDLYFAGAYALFLAGLLALTYGALPLLLERQHRPGSSIGGRLYA